MNRRWGLLLAGLLLAFQVQAQGLVAAQVQQGLEQFDQAAAGDAGAVDSALATFRSLLQEQPDSVWVKARLGSLTAMQGRDAWMPWNKIRYVEQGLDLLDAALEGLGPEAETRRIAERNVGLDVRLTAASTFSSIPGFFHRWPQAQSLFKEITSRPSFAHADNSIQARVWLDWAKLAKQRSQDAQSQQYLQKAVSLAPNSEPGKQAAARLAKETSK